MLVRGLLGRLTAEVSRTTSHDLPQLAALAHRAALRRCAVSSRHALIAPELFAGRAGGPRRFATAAGEGAAATSSAGKGAKKTKSTGAAGKAKKTGTTKKRGVKAKAKPKKKKAAVTRKPLSEAQKARREHAKALEKNKLLKLQALLTEPKQKPASAWTVLFMEDVKKGGSVTEVMRSAKERYRNLSASEREVGKFLSLLMAMAYWTLELTRFCSALQPYCKREQVCQ
jgi:hypothetical protein